MVVMTGPRIGFQALQRRLASRRGLDDDFGSPAGAGGVA
jgi:hypothetical protein